MKKEHLIQAYNFNRIPARIKEKTGKEAGVIAFTKDENINASYLLDEEGVITALILFSNCITKGNKTLANQLKHTTNTLIIIQKSIELLGNTTQEEANKILKALGLFNKNIKKKAVRFINYIYSVDVMEEILKFSIVEDNKNYKIPPSKSKKK